MIKCKTCDAGKLIRKKKYRMSGVVVVIGYILLIPSVLGILTGGLMLFATGSSAGTTMESIQKEARSALERGGVPAPIVAKVAASQPLTRTDSLALNREQLRSVESARMAMVASTAGAGVGASIAGGISIFVMVVSLVGGLLGWILIMRKAVLQCSNCGAVTAAS